MRVAVVIPALDEERTIGAVVTGMRAAIVALGHTVEVCVTDNGSRDRTAAEARAAGARVVLESERGYGAACLAALCELGTLSGLDAVVFADGDGADDPEDVQALLAPIMDDQADLVIGSRALGQRRGWVERASLTTAQRFGNRLATVLLRWTLAQHATDLGPFRAVTPAALRRLGMDDRGFGWTIQMQARAARLGLRTTEVPVHYRRRRAGRSKVSGDIRASLCAGAVILRVLAQEAARGVRRG